MRDLYVRHRAGCRYARKITVNSRGPAPRHVFGCGCPIYARYEIRDLTTGTSLEKFNGSLRGIATKEAAEEYLDNRFANVRAGQIRPAKRALTVGDAIGRFISEKKSSLPSVPQVRVSEHVVRAHSRLGTDPANREREVILKNRALLGSFQAFCEERGINLITEISHEHLIAFQQAGKGRTLIDPITNEKRQLEQAQITKQKNQEFLRAFFRRAIALDWIQVNPAERLLPIRAPKSRPKPFTDEQRQKLLELIPVIHPG